MGRPGVLQSMGSQRVKHVWVTDQQSLAQPWFTQWKALTPASMCWKAEKQEALGPGRRDGRRGSELCLQVPGGRI